jgi:hypothetical protein
MMEELKVQRVQLNQEERVMEMKQQMEIRFSEMMEDLKDQQIEMIRLRHTFAVQANDEVHQYKTLRQCASKTLPKNIQQMKIICKAIKQMAVVSDELEEELLKVGGEEEIEEEKESDEEESFESKSKSLLRLALETSLGYYKPSMTNMANDSNAGNERHSLITHQKTREWIRSPADSH